MNNLSVATAKGRINTAGCTKLAVFFLICLCFLCACPLNASDSSSNSYPCVKNGKLYSFDIEADAGDELNYCNLDGFAQNGVSVSKKAGWILAWQSKTQELYHIDTRQKVRSRIKVSAYLTYVNKNYILTQTNSFSDNKGFGFKLYKINYSWNNRKISVKKLWSGNADCFVSDCFFTSDGICIAGGTKDDTMHNVFYITEKGIHKCFSTAKNSDFLRLVNVGEQNNSIYAFLSGREKTAAQPVIYKFTLEGYVEGTNAASFIDLSVDSALPAGFECFFGYGFKMPAMVEPVETASVVVLPASVNGVIQFVCYDFEAGKIVRVVPDAVGCVASICSTDDGTYYVARDPLIEGSWYGIALFNGTECKKIKAF